MQALLGFGGNLGDVGAAFADAAAALGRRFRLLAVSGLWSTAPVGPPQRDFLNAAALVDVGVDPFRLHAFCQHLEAEAGRERRAEMRFGPRRLDLDLLLIADLVIVAPALVVPHPRLAERRFALLPAAQIAPGWVHPRLHRSLERLAAGLATSGQRCESAGAFPDLR